MACEVRTAESRRASLPNRRNSPHFALPLRQTFFLFSGSSDTSSAGTQISTCLLQAKLFIAAVESGGADAKNSVQSIALNSGVLAIRGIVTAAHHSPLRFCCTRDQQWLFIEIAPRPLLLAMGRTVFRHPRVWLRSWTVQDFGIPIRNRICHSRDHWAGIRLLSRHASCHRL